MTATADTNAGFWNKAARKYAASPLADVAGYERTLEATRAQLKPADAVLEFGCGTGTTALKLAPSVARYVATDFSPGMIDIGREKAAAGAPASLSFEVSTRQDARWSEGEFDAVLCYNVLHLVTDRAPVLAGVRRILKPGGRFISKTPCLSDMGVLMKTGVRVIVPLMQLAGRAPAVAWFTDKQLEAEIEAAGFAIAERARHGTKPGDIRPFLVAQKK